MADATKTNVGSVMEMGAIEFMNWWLFKKEEADEAKAKLERNKNYK